MTSLIQANIFFFITSIAVIVFAASVVVITVYAVRVLKDIKRFTEMMSQEGEKFVKDVESFRSTVRMEGTKVKTILSFFLDLFNRKRTIKTKRRTKDQGGSSSDQAE